LLGRRPFTPTRLPIPPERHYRIQLLYLPAFGVAVWLLMGGAAHSLLRLSGHHADLGRVLDVVGLGVPWPPAALAGAAASGVYVLLGARLVR
jgi:hypothetical protein